MKKKEDLRIVYMGTPEFAVESLKCLVEGGYNVVGVVTMPDKPMGRHQDVLQASPVKQYAVEHGLRVLQPVKLKDEAFVEELRSLRADLQIVVAFRMLPEVVWNMPPMGTFNLHASLLPQYRGAAPINWAVINGETETGITTFFLKHEIDTGEVIQQVRIPIADTDNVGVVHDKLMELGGRLVVETVRSPSAITPMWPPRQGPQVGVDTAAPAWIKVWISPSAMAWSTMSWVAGMTMQSAPYRKKRWQWKARCTRHRKSSRRRARWIGKAGRSNRCTTSYGACRLIRQPGAR